MAPEGHESKKGNDEHLYKHYDRIIIPEAWVITKSQEIPHIGTWEQK